MTKRIVSLADHERAIGLLHMKIGDSADTMRLVCGTLIKDNPWTANPGLVSCPQCLVLMEMFDLANSNVPHET